MRPSVIISVVMVVAAVVLLALRMGGDDAPPPPVTATPEPVARTPDPEPGPLPPVQPSQPAPAPTVSTEGEGPMQVDVGQGFDLDLLMREVGLDNFMGDYARWATSRGYPQPDDVGNLMLPQPYDQYDEETLQALADTGDMWAQQFLADKIARKRPADAIELYREAAVSGSVYAMSEMAQLYKRIANKNADTQFKGDNDALDQVYALRDAPGDPEVTAYAWAAVAERSGWDPMSGSVTAHVTGRNLTDEQIEEACELSRSLQDDMVQMRSERSIELPAATPPPLIVGSGPQGSMGTRCAEDEPPPWDMSGCREVALNSGDQTNTIWVCNSE